jgi:osmotically inducible protein OsmC
MHSQVFRKDFKMTEFYRKAGVIWNGDLKEGGGVISTESKVLLEQPYTYKGRFEDEEATGTNPEELIAAAHAACFSMALASTLKKNGFEPKKATTTATCELASQNGGFAITSMQLNVRAEVPDIDNPTFQELVIKADNGCPVSNLLRNGLNIEIDATLI